MHSDFITLASRQALLRKALAIAAEARARSARLPPSDARILAAFGTFAAIEHEKQGLLADGSEGDRWLGSRIARHIGDQEDCLERMCAAEATTIEAQRARAISYALLDAGELAYRAGVGRATEDVLLVAVVRDLIQGSGSR